jgi:hypothetical protein
VLIISVSLDISDKERFWVSILHICSESIQAIARKVWTWSVMDRSRMMKDTKLSLAWPKPSEINGQEKIEHTVVDAAS